MKKYEKMVVSINDSDFNCYANKGDWLYKANDKDTKNGLFRLPKDIHFFVSLNEDRLPSEIGVVKKIDGYITAHELAVLDYSSRKKDINQLNDNIISEYEWFLEKVNAFPEHTPVALTWLEKVFPQKIKELRLHKKFFTGMSREGKEELFQN
ncbi:hypothetical protein [Niallia taxi]|uniref:hypothetical protein n=1 Tax=Niallia taxi TaxID=2499688 RepID=UPI003D26C21F